MAVTDDKVRLTRNQLAKVSEDHETIKQLELLIAIVNDLALRVYALENP